jgi:hypothetical protein
MGTAFGTSNISRSDIYVLWLLEIVLVFMDPHQQSIQ